MGKLAITTKKDYVKKSVDDIFPMSITGFNQFSDNLDKQIFFGDLTATTVGTATATTETTGQPISLAETYLFDPEFPDNRPLTNRAQKSFPKIVTTATASGAKFPLNNIAIDSDGTIRLTIKSLLLTPTFTVKLTSTTGTDTITWTAQKLAAGSKANQWTTLTLEMSKGVKAGTIDYNKFTEIEVISSIVNTISLFELEVANNSTCFLGAIHQSTIACITEWEDNLEKESTDILCGTIGEDNTLTGGENMLTVQTKNLNLEQRAFFLGESVKKGSVYDYELINASSNASYNLAISGSALVLPFTRLISGIEIRLKVDGQDYRLTDNPLDVGRGEFSFEQDPVTFAITLTIGNGDVTGKIPEISIIVPTIGSYSNDTYKLGNYFVIFAGEKAGVGQSEKKFYYKCQVTNYQVEKDDYSQASIEIKVMTVIKDRKPTFSKTALIN